MAIRGRLTKLKFGNSTEDKYLSLWAGGLEAIHRVLASEILEIM